MVLRFSAFRSTKAPFAWILPFRTEPLPFHVHGLRRPSTQSFSTAPSTLSSTRAQKRKPRDAYAQAQARQRKAANVARQVILRRERQEAMGDPVQSKPTPFLRALDQITTRPEVSADIQDAHTSGEQRTGVATASDPTTLPASVLNYGVRPRDLRESLQHSYFLTEPEVESHTGTTSADEDQRRLVHQGLHMNATLAMTRIMSLSNGESIDRRRAQTRECIEKFGRHRTDTYLPPKPLANVPRSPSLPPPPVKTPRAGPDTGSSEVQISLLTLKIRALASHLAGSGKKDLVNKRNLHLLVHRRQKLMKYLRRKERGAARWQHVVETLGLTDRMWKGEVSLP